MAGLSRLAQPPPVSHCSFCLSHLLRSLEVFELEVLLAGSLVLASTE